MGNVKELAGKGDHAVDEIGVDDGFANFAFARLIGGHGAIGEDKAGDAVGREVMDEVLDPGEVGVASGRDAIFPANVLGETRAAPIAIVEWWIRQNLVRYEVLMQVENEEKTLSVSDFPL